MTNTASYLSLSEVAAIAPGRPHVSAVWRWCRKGVLARNGERVKLRHIRVGARVFVPDGALEEFAQTLAQADATYFDGHAPSSTAARAPTTCRGRTEDQRNRDIDAARRRLEQKGVL
jgi:hypothetical protein